MSEEQINFAIAEACGLAVFANTRPTDLPNYCNDLNAIHEAEKLLDPLGNDGRYEYWLRTVCHIPERESAKGRYFYRATARQRAEAFLRTLGKWEGAK
jgi:hypothetical protein